MITKIYKEITERLKLNVYFYESSGKICYQR